MGRPKALLPLRGRPVVVWHAERLATVCAEVIVVVGADADAVGAALPAGARAVVNPAWATSWPADSLRLALEAADVRGEALVTPVDVLPARADTLAALIAAEGPVAPVGSDGRPGHPVLLDAVTVAAVRRAAPSGGLRALLAGAARVPVEDPDVAEDFDDPLAWERLAAAFRG